MKNAKKAVKKKASNIAAKPAALAKLAKAGAKKMSANARRAEELVALILRRMERIVEDFYDIGEALRKLSKKELYSAAGYSSFAALLEARGLMSVQQAAKLIAIVESVPRTKALELGSEKAYALTRFVAATPEPDTVATVLETGLVVGNKTIAVADASSRDIIRASREVRKKSGKISSHEKSAVAAAKKAQAALRKQGLKLARVTTKKEKGVWWAWIGVPIESVAKLRAGK